MIRVLFTTPILEHPALGGPQLRIANSIIALNRVCDLRVFSRNAGANAPGSSLEHFLTVNSRDFFFCKPYRFDVDTPRVFRLIERIFKSIYDPRVRQQARQISDYVQKNEISIVWFGYGNISLRLIRQVRHLLPAANIVCDTDSVWSRFVLRRIPFVPLWRKPFYLFSGKLAEHRERALSHISDVITAVSEEDVRYYSQICTGKAAVMRFSNVLESGNYGLTGQQRVDVKRPSIYLAGTFGHRFSPMDFGCRWFLEEVLPIVKREIPEIKFYIAGNRSDERFGDKADDTVSVLGRLTDLTSYLREMDVSIVPLFFESGTRFKILEAASCDVAIVSTSLGAEGFDMNDGEHLMIADTAETFATSIIKVIRNQDLHFRLTLAARQFVLENCTLSNLMQEGNLVLDHLAKD